MTSYSYNYGDNIVNDLYVTSLENNYGLLTVTSQHCNIGSINSNYGLISVAERSSVGELKRNAGDVDLMFGSRIGSIDDNSGNIIVNQESDVGLINQNYGEISIGSSCVISKINVNHGNIIIEDNCTIDVVCDNIANIQLGNDCVIKSIIGKRGNIQCGVGCFVPVAAPSFTNPHDSSFAFFIGSGILTETNGTGTFEMPENVVPQFHQQFQPQQQQSAPFQNQSVQQQASVEEEMLCAICMENRKDTVFNCGHTCCELCSRPLCQCHICRGQILQKIKFFL